MCSDDAGLDPFLFRAGLLPTTLQQANGIYVSIPSCSGPDYYVLLRYDDSCRNVSIPSCSGPDYYAISWSPDVNRNRLDPFLFRAGLLPKRRGKFTLTAAVSIPSCSGPDYYPGPAAGQPGPNRLDPFLFRAGLLRTGAVTLAGGCTSRSLLVQGRITTYRSRR